MDLTNLPYLITAGFYLIAVLGFSFLSIFAIYILLRYGKSLSTAGILSAVYAVIFFGLLISSFSTLQGLK